jgi:hypothetical protein
MLFVIMISSICNDKLVGNVSGILSELACMSSFIEVSACWVSMLVYIDTTSAEKSSALEGMSRCLRSWMTAVEFFM